MEANGGLPTQSNRPILVLSIAITLLVLPATSGIAGTASPTGSCQDVDETLTGIATGVPDETLLGTSLEAHEVVRDIGSSDCRIASLDATLTTSEEPTTNYTNDADLIVSFENITLATGHNFGTDETVSLNGTPWGTYQFTVEPWSALEAPYTLEISADLEPASDPSGDNADDETVVVAVVDTGINPYHHEFSAEGYPGSLNLSEHPSEYLEEYPEEAQELNLSLDDPFYQAVEDDDWANVTEDRLYWIPGTKIVGAYDGGGSLDSGDNVRDEHGHGTASASVAAGNTLGSCERCLIVSVEGAGGLGWALAQPWIDLVSNSWSTLGNVGVPTAGHNDVDPAGLGGGFAEQTRSAVTRGQTVLFAAGNGMANAFLTPQTTYTSPLAGPDWTMTVGALSKYDDCDCPNDEGFVATSGKPVDVSSYAVGDIPAAHHASSDGLTQHGGTSAATPIVAGVMGETLLDAREAVGDTVGGTRDAAIAEGTPVEGPEGGMLADGELTRAELERAIKLTAEHTASHWIDLYPLGAPTGVLPSSTLSGQFAAEGWGIVAERTGVNATDVVLGEQPLPERPLDAEQADKDEANRAALWGDPVEP